MNLNRLGFWREMSGEIGIRNLSRNVERFSCFVVFGGFHTRKVVIKSEGTFGDSNLIYW